MATYSSPDRAVRAAPAFSLLSIFAVVAAVGSFNVAAGWGLLLAIVAIVLGALGVVIALRPGVRGGILSLFSIVAGAIGILGALLRIIF